MSASNKRAESELTFEKSIRELIRGTIQRARTETMGCSCVAIAFTAIILQSDSGSLEFYGWLVVLMAVAFIVSVVWSFTLRDKLLDAHPIAEQSFWIETIQKQSRLLRLVPVWYRGPFFLGMVLCLYSSPLETGMNGLFRAAVMTVAAIAMATCFAWIVWSNRQAATQLDAYVGHLNQEPNTSVG